MSEHPLQVIFVALLLYVVVASAKYRFSHPEMTETELLLHMGDAVLWRD